MSIQKLLRRKVRSDIALTTIAATLLSVLFVLSKTAAPKVQASYYSWPGPINGINTLYANNLGNYSTLAPCSSKVPNGLCTNPAEQIAWCIVGPHASLAPVGPLPEAIRYHNYDWYLTYMPEAGQVDLSIYPKWAIVPTMGLGPGNDWYSHRIEKQWFYENPTQKAIAKSHCSDAVFNINFHDQSNFASNYQMFNYPFEEYPKLGLKGMGIK